MRIFPKTEVSLKVGYLYIMLLRSGRPTQASKMPARWFMLVCEMFSENIAAQFIPMNSTVSCIVYAKLYFVMITFQVHIWDQP